MIESLLYDVRSLCIFLFYLRIWYYCLYSFILEMSNYYTFGYNYDRCLELLKSYNSKLYNTPSHLSIMETEMRE